MKKKFLIALLVALMLCLFALTASAANEVTLVDGTKADLGTVFTVKNNQVTGFNSGYSKNDVVDVIFPDEIEGLEANFLFSEATSLKTITFAASDAFFISGDNIFTKCSVEKITFNPNCVVEIRKGNFSSCTNLKEITFPKFKKLAGSAFKSCTSMVATNELVFAEGMTEIGGHAFNGCTSLSGTVVFPSTLETIQEYSFQNTGFEHFDLSKCANLTAVGGGYGGPFTDNDNITSLDLSGCTSLKVLKSNFASSCDNLTEVILPPNLTEIPHKAFAHCYKLASIVLPASVTYVADEAFHSARSGQTVKTFTVYLQSNVNFHEKYPFRDSSAKIEYVLIGEGMTAESFIAANTFSGITGATVVDYLDPASPWTYTTGGAITSHTIVENYCASLALTGEHAYVGNPCVVRCTECELTTVKENPEHNLSVSITYADGYLKDGKIITECENAGCSHKTEVIADALFTSKGYSQDENSNAVVLDFNVNKEAIEAYEEYLGTKVSYGVVAALAKDEYEGSPLNGDASAKDGAISMAFENTDFTILQLKLTGIDKKDDAFYCCGYIAFDGSVAYINGNEVAPTALKISYNNYTGITNEE